MEQLLYDAATAGNEARFKELLWGTPGVDVNWKNGYGMTSLHKAASRGCTSIVALLLCHPAIEVNPVCDRGFTPFLLSCVYGHTACVRRFLKDPRVSLQGLQDVSAFWVVAREGHVDVVKRWIGSSRDIDLVPEKNPDAIEVARMNNWVAVSLLLEVYQRDPKGVRLEMRKHLRQLDNAAAARIFAMMVFVSDGLLEIRRLKAKEVPEKGFCRAARFFNILRKLPMDLQMLVSHQMVDSPRQNVTATDADVAIRALAKCYPRPVAPVYPTVFHAWWHRLSAGHLVLSH